MARLTAAQRNRLPASAFADPKNRKYPITDKTHAALAKGMAAKYAGSSLESKVDSKANKKLGESPSRTGAGHDKPGQHLHHDHPRAKHARRAPS